MIGGAPIVRHEGRPQDTAEARTFARWHRHRGAHRWHRTAERVGFDNGGLRAELDTRGAMAVIPPKADRARRIACDLATYRSYRW